MKKYLLDFIHRGLIACGFGPIVIAIIFLLLRKANVVDTISVDEMCLGIFTLSGLAFIVGGSNFIYQIERLPLMFAILIHGSILYISYLAVYLVNGWLKWGTTPILAFTGIFVIGYLIIWIIIYGVLKQKTAKINVMLKMRHENQLNE